MKEKKAEVEEGEGDETGGKRRRLPLLLLRASERERELWCRRQGAISSTVALVSLSLLSVVCLLFRCTVFEL